MRVPRVLCADWEYTPIWRYTSDVRWYHTERCAVATPPLYTLWPVAANIARTLTIEIAAAVGARRPAQARARRSVTTPPPTLRDDGSGGGAMRRRRRRRTVRWMQMEEFGKHQQEFGMDCKWGFGNYWSYEDVVIEFLKIEFCLSKKSTKWLYWPTRVTVRWL